MVEEIYPVRFFSTQSGDEPNENGNIVRPIAASAIEQHDREWKPYIADADDAEWQWQQWVMEGSPFAEGKGYRHYALLQKDIVHGMLIVRETHKMRSPDNGLTDGCFLEYLAVAPWNRTNARTGTQLCDLHPKARPIGKMLVGRAIQLSLELGYEGRLAWEAKKSAVNQYKKWFPEAWDAEIMDDDGVWWPYFELTPAHGDAFLQEMAKFLDCETVL